MVNIHEETIADKSFIPELKRPIILFFLFFSYSLFAWHLLSSYNQPIGKKFLVLCTAMLLCASIICKKILCGSGLGSWRLFGLISKEYLKKGLAEWTHSTRNHFLIVEKPICLSISVAFLISAGVYFLSPINSIAFQSFIPEHISLYSMVNTFTQRLAYQIFLCIIIGTALYFAIFKKSVKEHDIIPRQWSTLLGTLVLAAAASNVWTSSLDNRAVTTLFITIIIAFSSYYHNLRLLPWFFIVSLIVFAMLPAWLHAPEPPFMWLKTIDQHYDSIVYRGRQLAAGHLFSADAPPLYSMLWSTLLGILAQRKSPPLFAELVRFVQIGQLLCVAGFMLAAWLRTYAQSRNSRAFAMTFFTVAVISWLSSDSPSTWFPNQSGFRFLFFPIAICSVYLIEKTSAIQAGLVAGLIAGLALIANFETGVVVTAGLGVAWLTRLRNEPFQIWLYSATFAFAMLLVCYFALNLLYYHFFRAPIFPNGMGSLFSKLSFNGGFGGLNLPFRSIVIVILAHASYKLIQFVRGLFNYKSPIPDAVTSTIAAMLLVWFPYYINRPDDWNLWSFIALYSLLILPKFKGSRNDIVPIIVAFFIILPISARNFPASVIDTFYLKDRPSEIKQICSGGLVLPKDFCAHLQVRTKTLQDIASQGSIGWSTTLPVLTDQTTNVIGPFWTGNLLGITLTINQFNELVKKIKQKKLDFILFDDPNDLYIQPRSADISFDHRLYQSLQHDFCAPQLKGGWLIAQRKEKGRCYH